MMEQIIAHIRLSKLENETRGSVQCLENEQELKKHLKMVSRYAGEFAEKIGLKHCGEIVGLLHDVGKASKKFQLYIRNAVYHGKSSSKPDHATVGARILYDRYYTQVKAAETGLSGKETRLRLIEILANVILGHHGGLYAYYSLNESAVMEKRLLKNEEDMFLDEANQYLFSQMVSQEELDCLVEEAAEEFEALYSKVSENKEMSASFIAKFLFSCLIDADRLDSFLFEENKGPDAFFKEKENARRDLWERAHQELMQSLEKLKENKGPLNKYRREISDVAERRADEMDTGIITLNIPTGAGKTLTAMRFALRHAINTGKKRIFYITNYLTVIEQNAAAIREKIPSLKDNILEFHSNVINEKEETESDNYIWESKQNNLLQERWENSVIFTSVVQFQNTFFAGKNAYRKLHQLADSVIIFDEVQSLPTNNIILFCQAVNFLRLMNTTAISCTATQPHYQKLEGGFAISDTQKQEIIQNPMFYFEAFRRTKINFCDKEHKTVEEVASFLEDKLNSCKSLLMIVNTVKAARDIFLQMSKREEYDCYYLSTALCPAHRKKVIEDLCGALKAVRQGENSGKVVCISTPIVEAGVDISFEVVVRSVAGLDSIAQAAGRCNREREKEEGQVYIVILAEKLENVNPLKDIVIRQELTKDKLRVRLKYDDLLYPSTLEGYFNSVHRKQKEEYKFPIDLKDSGGTVILKAQSIFDILNSNQNAKKNTKCKVDWINRADIKTAESEFYVIPQKGKGILVPYKGEGVNGEEIISELLSEKTLTEKYDLLKKAQQITISVFDSAFQDLAEKKMIYAVSKMEGVYVLNESFYSNDIGFRGAESTGEITPFGDWEGRKA